MGSLARRAADDYRAGAASHRRQRNRACPVGRGHGSIVNRAKPEPLLLEDGAVRTAPIGEAPTFQEQADRASGAIGGHNAGGIEVVKAIGQLLAGIARLGAKDAAKSRCRPLHARRKWFIAYRMQKESGALPESLSGLSTLESPPDRYWADPFPVQNNNEYYLFFEEVLHATGRGRIAVRRWRDGAWNEPCAVLDRPYHLSYPFVFSWENRWYLVPESIASTCGGSFGAARNFSTRWKFECNLMEGVRAPRIRRSSSATDDFG